MTSSIVLVARTSTTLWRRELASVFGVRERALTAGLAVFAVVMLAFSLFLAWVLNDFVSTVVPAEGVPDDQRPLLRLVIAGLMLGSTVYFLVVCATLPSRDRLATALTLLPVARWRAQAGTLLPAFAVGSAVALIFGLPTVPMMVKLVDPARVNPAAFAVFVATIALIALLVPGLFFVLRDLCARVLRLPLVYSLAIAVAVTLVIVVSVVGVDIIPTASIDGEPSGFLLLPARAISEVLQPASSSAPRLVVAGVALTVWFGLAVALATRAVRRPASTDGRPVAAPTIPLPNHGSARFAVFMQELVTLTRLPQFVVTAIVLLLASIALPLAYVQATAQSAVDQVASLPVIAASAIGSYSYGTTRRYHWVMATVSRPRLWIITKPLAALTLSATLCALYLVLMTVAGLPRERLLDIAMLGLAMWASATVAGVLVPFTADQPLSATVTSAATVVLWALSTFGMRWVFSTIQIDSPVPPAMCWVAVTMTIYGMVAVTARNPVAAGA